ncbi:MAG: PilZ domain-containing protein [Nitrospira sp.]|nr:PilZ domain-containing protein [Nitrospira sp.]
MVVRKHPRFPVSFTGAVIHQRESHPISKSMDLSRKGCRVQSTFPAFTGMKVDLQLNLPDLSTSLHIRGAVVRWASPQGIGIEFPPLPSSAEQQLERLIRRLEATAEQASLHNQTCGAYTGSLR